MSRTTEADCIRALLAQASARIGGDTARLDAEVLLAHALQQPRSYLLTWPERCPNPAQHAHFTTLVERRSNGEPVAHLTGQREFWSLQLVVTPDTLIPRPETETLVACALERLPSDRPCRVADLGTGSGSIALALASERPACQLLATDASSAALAQARANAEQLGIRNVDFAAGSWCAALTGAAFDLVVSNPPYIATGDPHLSDGDVRFEPRSALVAGHDGLDDIRTIIACAHRHLVKGGSLMLEHGYDQGPAVRQLLDTQGYRDITTMTDLSGLDRVTAGST